MPSLSESQAANSHESHESLESLELSRNVSFQSTCQCAGEFTDVNSGQYLCVITRSSTSTVIGLTVNDELQSTEPDRLFSSPLVLILFVIETRPDGHWITTQPQLPATINGQPVTSAMLLSSGSILTVGDRIFRYEFDPRRTVSGSSLVVDTGPIPGDGGRLGELQDRPAPAKPRRINQSDPTSDSTSSSVSDIDDVPTENDVTERGSSCGDAQVLHQLKKDGSEPLSFLSPSGSSIDYTALPSFNSPEQLYRYCASVVARELMLGSNISSSSSVSSTSTSSLAVNAGALAFTPRDIDLIYKAFQEVVSIQFHRQLFRTFVENIITSTEGRGKQADEACVTSSADNLSGDSCTPPSSGTLHSAVVELVTNLIAQTVEPVEYVILYLRLLVAFSEFDVNLSTFTSIQTAQIVVGCMSAHEQQPAVQQLGAEFLERLARLMTTKGGNASHVFRESTVELIVTSLRSHASDRLAVRSAVRCLAAITSALSGVSTESSNISANITISPPLSANREKNDAPAVDCTPTESENYIKSEPVRHKLRSSHSPLCRQENVTGSVEHQVVICSTAVDDANRTLEYIADVAYPVVLEMRLKYAADQLIHVHSGTLMNFFASRDDRAYSLRRESIFSHVSENDFDAAPMTTDSANVDSPTEVKDDSSQKEANHPDSPIEVNVYDSPRSTNENDESILVSLGKCPEKSVTDPTTTEENCNLPSSICNLIGGGFSSHSGKIPNDQSDVDNATFKFDNILTSAAEEEENLTEGDDNVDDDEDFQTSDVDRTQELAKARLLLIGRVRSCCTESEVRTYDERQRQTTSSFAKSSSRQLSIENSSDVSESGDDAVNNINSTWDARKHLSKSKSMSFFSDRTPIRQTSIEKISESERDGRIGSTLRRRFSSVPSLLTLKPLRRNRCESVISNPLYDGVSRTRCKSSSDLTVLNTASLPKGESGLVDCTGRRDFTWMGTLHESSSPSMAKEFDFRSEMLEERERCRRRLYGIVDIRPERTNMPSTTAIDHQIQMTDSDVTTTPDKVSSIVTSNGKFNHTVTTSASSIIQDHEKKSSEQYTMSVTDNLPDAIQLPPSVETLSRTASSSPARKAGIAGAMKHYLRKKLVRSSIKSEGENVE